MTPRALHYHDAAGTAQRIVSQARRDGEKWDWIPFPGWAAYRPAPFGLPVHKGRTRLLREYLRHKAGSYDVLHVHNGLQAENACRVKVPHVVHLHGTDIRSRQYEPQYARTIRVGVLAADAVVYATPELGHHVAPLRDNALYLPIPITTSEMPRRAQTEKRFGAFFVSRWEDVKGGEQQLSLAQRVLEKDPSVRLRGLDWGNGAAKARRIGVKLLPRMSHERFLATLASSRVAIGQAMSILSTSELEALALGLPLISPFQTEYYPGLERLSDDHIDAMADGIIAAYREPDAAVAAQKGDLYVAEHHETSVIVERLRSLYASIL